MKQVVDRIVPLRGEVLVKRRDVKMVTDSGVHLPFDTVERPPVAVICKIGEGTNDSNGLLELSATVLTDRYGGRELEDGYLLVKADTILGVMNKYNRALIPCGRRVLLSIVEDKACTSSLIVIPDTVKVDRTVGIVEAVGADCFELDVTDKVYVTPNVGLRYVVDGLSLLVVDESKVLGIFE